MAIRPVADDGGSRASASPAYERVPPHNVEAEESVLGSMLLSKDAIAEVLELLREDDFYRPAHRTVFRSVLELYGHGDAVDAVTVQEELRRNGSLADIGGAPFLHTLVASVPTAANASYYARIVKEAGVLRRLIDVGTQIVQLGFETPQDTERAVDIAESLVYQVAQGRVTEDYHSLRDVLTGTLEAIERLHEDHREITGVPTGFPDLDRLTSGLQPSNLIIVAARPAVGKALALDTPLPTPTGWTTMGEVAVGDQLIAADGKPTTVVAATDVMHGRPCYEVEFSDGTVIVADARHQWLTQTRASRTSAWAAARRYDRARTQRTLPSVKTTEEVLATLRCNGAERRLNHAVVNTRPLDLPAQELPLPPYALGAWLGDGQPESRADRRPMLSDLRESGCLTADTRIMRADNGVEESLGQLLLRGERDIPVWTLDDDLRLVKGTMTHVFSSGVKPVYELRLASGRRVKASANHPFLTVDGWRPLEELTAGDRLAVPRELPAPTRTRVWPEPEVVMLAHLLGDGCFVSRQPLHYTSADPANLEAVEQAAAHFGVTPRRVAQDTWAHVYLPAPFRLTHGKRNPIAAWLDGMGLFGLRSYEKFIPTGVFSLPDHQIALFLHHLWATDGSVRRDGRRGRIYYASSSRRLVDDLQSLLLRLGIRGRVKRVQKEGYRPGYHLYLYGAENQLRFLELVGVHGARGAAVEPLATILRLVLPTANTNVDTIPREIWTAVKTRMREAGVTTRALQAGIGTQYCGSTLYKAAPGRARLARVAGVLDDDRLARLAGSDVFWDAIVAIEPLGEEPVYDATVLGTHNFIADGVVVHNSLEQDADMVVFIYRDEVYDPESARKGEADFILAKHRNGPTDTVTVTFQGQYSRFAPMAARSL